MDLWQLSALDFIMELLDGLFVLLSGFSCSIIEAKILAAKQIALACLTLS